jgi:hypothetical protein
MTLIGGDMPLRSSFEHNFRRFLRLVLVSTAACALGMVAAGAAVIVSVESTIAAAGSSGNAFDVELTNSGPNSLLVGGFSFGIVTANPNITFQGANTSTTNSYIFEGASLLGPDLAGPDGQSLTAADAFDTPLSGVSLTAGSTVGLGHILFDVSPFASPGSFPVDLEIFPVTSLADPSANNIAIDTLVSGEITITGGIATPEPSSLLLVFAGVIGLGSLRRYQRASRKN